MKKRTSQKSKRSKASKLTSITSAPKSVKVYSNSTKQSKVASGVLYRKILTQEAEDTKRLNKWHGVRASAKSSTAAKKKVQKITGFKRSKDGKIIAVEK